MKRQFTANYKKEGEWYSGWVEEIPGVNTQGSTLGEVKENLREAIFLVLDTNRLMHKTNSKQKIIKENLTVFI